jgi:hypothetical protein
MLAKNLPPHTNISVRIIFFCFLVCLVTLSVAQIAVSSDKLSNGMWKELVVA